VKVIPDKIPSIYNGEKTVIYGLLMEKSDQSEDKLKFKATLTGDIVGKEFKFDIPFQLPSRQGEEDVAVIHQLAVKQMIQEWQDDGGLYENKHKQEIIELSCDASVVSRYTAYVAVDEAQKKPVPGSMQAYELNTIAYQPVRILQSLVLDIEQNNRIVELNNLRCEELNNRCEQYTITLSARRRTIQTSNCCGGTSSPQPRQCSNISQSSRNVPSSATPVAVPPSTTPVAVPPSTTPVAVPPKQSDPSFIVGLQQANGSWLLNDQLAGAMSKSVQELKKCCPVSCDVITVANVWATLVAIEFLKKKYSSMMEELEFVIMKAEQWLGKQVLPADVNLAVLKDSASKVV